MNFKKLITSRSDYLDWHLEDGNTVRGNKGFNICEVYDETLDNPRRLAALISHLPEMYFLIERIAYKEIPCVNHNYHNIMCDIAKIFLFELEHAVEEESK